MPEVTLCYIVCTASPWARGQQELLEPLSQGPCGTADWQVREPDSFVDLPLICRVTLSKSFHFSLALLLLLQFALSI